MESKHTKGTWYFEKHSDTSEYVGNIIVDLGHPKIRTVACILDYAGKDEAIANAEFICKAVNAHDELVWCIGRLIESIKEYGFDDYIPTPYYNAINCLKKVSDSTPIKQDQNEQDKI